MPNKAAKRRKRKRYLLNAQLNKQGRTANQYKKYLKNEQRNDY